MLRRIMASAAALLLLLTVCPAGAETYVYHALGFDNRDTAAVFSAGTDAELMNALAQAGFGGDAVISGVTCDTESAQGTNIWKSQWAAVALLHEGKTLLIYGTRDDRNGWLPWTLTPVSDIFLPAGEPIELRALPFRDMRTGEITDVMPAVIRGGTLFYYLTKRTGELFCVRTEEGKGTGTEILYREDGRAAATVWKNGQETETYSARFLWPRALEFWRMQDVPTDIARLRSFEAAHLVPSAAEYGVARGGHLRAEATGSSRDLGEIVCAQVRVLGSKPGRQYPWYHVILGDMEGWISSPYLDQDPMGGDVLADWAQRQGVGVIQGEQPLRASPGGESKGSLKPGQMVHILLLRDGYYCVSVPRGEASWHQDAEGQCGWVPADQVKTYPSPLQARLGMGERKLIAGE